VSLCAFRADNWDCRMEQIDAGIDAVIENMGDLIKVNTEP
jgi:hypothetical protein